MSSKLDQKETKAFVEFVKCIKLSETKQRSILRTTKLISGKFFANFRSALVNCSYAKTFIARLIWHTHWLDSLDLFLVNLSSLVLNRGIEKWRVLFICGEFLAICMGSKTRWDFAKRVSPVQLLIRTELRSRFLWKSFNVKTYVSLLRK